MVGFDLMWFIFSTYSLPCGSHTFSIGVHRLDSRGIEDIILILEKVRYDLIIGPIYTASYIAKCIFMLGDRKLSDDAKLGEYGGWSTSSKPFHAQQPYLYTIFQSPELLIQCGFIWKDAMPLVLLYQERLNLMHDKFHRCGTNPY